MSLTTRALVLATERAESWWQRACRATSPAAKSYYVRESDRMAALATRLRHRLETMGG